MSCYWWWLSSNVTEGSIKRDLEGMKSHGYAGAILVDSDDSGSRRGNLTIPEGPVMGSPQWMKLYVYALALAKELGLQISLNVTSQLNVGVIGGPTVTPEDALKLLTYSRTTTQGGGSRTLHLPAPPIENGFYRQIAVLAYPSRHGCPAAGRLPIRANQKRARAGEAGARLADYALGSQQSRAAASRLAGMNALALTFETTLLECRR